jgi:hypothetical protein
MEYTTIRLAQHTGAEMRGIDLKPLRNSCPTVEDSGEVFMTIPRQSGSRRLVLDWDWLHVNHASFGAAPRVVLGSTRTGAVAWRPGLAGSCITFSPRPCAPLQSSSAH